MQNNAARHCKRYMQTPTTVRNRSYCVLKCNILHNPQGVMHFHSDYWYVLHTVKAPVTLDQIEPPSMKRRRTFVIHWQKGQSGRKTETRDVHAPDMERLKRTSNDYIMNGFSSTSQMSPNE